MKHKDTSGISSKKWIQIFLSSPIVLIVSNWLLQGMRYMEPGELTLKIVLTLIPSLLIFFLISYAKGSIILWQVVLVLFLVHTFNWVFNGQIFVLARYLPFNCKMTIEKMDSFIREIHTMSSEMNSLEAVLIFGSLSRGEITSTSDLDVRIMRRKGVIKALKAYMLAVKLRAKAFIRRFPLDIYTFGDMSYLRRSREDEPPVVIIDNKFVEKHYDVYSIYEEISATLKSRNEP